MAYNQNCEGCPYNPKSEVSYAMVEGLSREVEPIDSEVKGGNKTLFIFQSPGRVEWDKGKPLQNSSFQSAAGRIQSGLKRTKKNAGARNDYFDVTNALLCYQGKSSARDRVPKKLARTKCRANLLSLIKKGNYKLIVAFGEVAGKSLCELVFENKELFSKTELKSLPHPTGGLSNKELDQLLSQLPE